MTEPYSAGVTAQEPERRRLGMDEPTDDEIAAGVLALFQTLIPRVRPEVEQDTRDAEARWRLERYYQETWAIARAQDTTRRTP